MSDSDASQDVAKADPDASAKAEEAVKELAEAEAALKEASAKAEEAREKAKKATEEEYKAIAAAIKANPAKKVVYTHKRESDEIFRRDMGEPEFFLDKKDRFPRPILTQEHQESLTRKAEMPVDNTPKYVPQHVLSPEHSGVSNYENGIISFLEEARKKLQDLKRDPESTMRQVGDAKDKIAYLESLHENYYIGMNVFRTAHGGRDKLKK